MRQASAVAADRRIAHCHQAGGGGIERQSTGSCGECVPGGIGTSTVPRPIPASDGYVAELRIEAAYDTPRRQSLPERCCC